MSAEGLQVVENCLARTAIWDDVIYVKHDSTFGCRASSACSARESIALKDLKAEPQRGCPRRGLLNHENACRDTALSLFVNHGRAWRHSTHLFAGSNSRRALRRTVCAPSILTEPVDGSHPTAKAARESGGRHLAAVLFQFAILRLPSKDLPDPLHFGKIVLVCECQMRATIRESPGTTDQMHGIPPSDEVLLKTLYRVSSPKRAIF